MTPPRQPRQRISTSRRTHRKSRNGCLQCKQRHVKCDEAKPKCTQCTVVDRSCRYAEAQARLPRRFSPLRDALSAPGSQKSSNLETTAPNTAALANSDSTASPAPIIIPYQICVLNTPALAYHGRNFSLDRDGADATSDSSVNISHIEFITHFTLATAVPEIDPDLLQMGTDMVLKKSLATPCLLYEVLAISARHLAVQKPDKHDFYIYQAVQLQTKAIAMFNETRVLDRSNCEAMLLFSSFLSRHSLVDTFTNRDGDFPSFLDRFVQCAETQKGIKAVSHATWPLLAESDLSPFLEWGGLETNRPSRGQDCDELRRLLSIAPGLDPLSKESCRAAAFFLQLGFDELASPTPGKNPYQMIFSWNIFLPGEFYDLLRFCRPEAVAVMGWYAALLHRAQDIWQIADVGTFLLSSVAEFLGPEWGHWLEGPHAMIAV